MDNIEKMEKEKEMEVFDQKLSSDELGAIAGGTKDDNDNRGAMVVDRNTPSSGSSPAAILCS